MAKSIFITGTGTDVGKTYVSALIVKKLQEASGKAAYYKAAMSGNDRDANNQLIPGDALWVKKISNLDQPLAETCPYIYETAVSPHLASKLEKDPVNLTIVKKQYEKLKEKYEYITVEGSGGIICPIRFDEQKIFLEDIVKALNLSSILVCDAGLGTINHVVLTVHYMQSKGMNVKGIIFNNFQKDNFLHEDNLKMCEELTGIPVITTVEKGASELSIDANALMALYE